MAATIIDGKGIAETIRAEVGESARRLKAESGIVPGLAFILVGENPASVSYVKSKGKACEELGFYSITEQVPATIKEAELLRMIHAFNLDSDVHGVLVQLPLPKHIDEMRVIEAISPEKDVDGFHPVTLGKMVLGVDTNLPCTPAGIWELMRRSEINPSGKHVVVLGRSNIVGKPIANILLQKREWSNAIVTIAHTAAADLGAYSRQADILIVAIGKPGAVNASMVKPGAVVIDVGINRVPDSSKKSGYRVVGDVDFESVKDVAGAITPVPGGIGPMTIAMLMMNTLNSARRHGTASRP
ncbi:MAG TPA: bifunctional methylenetetrahydrofolate dehydrogenase/methenyltetrahydrofolate cyclohydrolase FolD [Bacteroidota bacterium]|nr:bifunctional methylenetetrahydrofolate dehydrogenase/methenyltetrahydrofolate cyclohydrolase FolD [Bacteroidota bacterium]